MFKEGDPVALGWHPDGVYVFERNVEATFRHYLQHDHTRCSVQIDRPEIKSRVQLPVNMLKLLFDENPPEWLKLRYVAEEYADSLEGEYATTAWTFIEDRLERGYYATILQQQYFQLKRKQDNLISRRAQQAWRDSIMAERDDSVATFLGDMRQLFPGYAKHDDIQMLYVPAFSKSAELIKWEDGDIWSRPLFWWNTYNEMRKAYNEE